MGVKRRLAALSCASLLAGVIGSGTAFALPETQPVSATIQSYTIEDGYEPILTYITHAGDSVRFNRQQALSDGASQELIEAGEFVNSYAIAAEDRLSLPVWGRYCGPGHSGPGTPVDQLDTACMHHDNCYSRKGYFNCSCDQELISEINSRFSKMKTAEKVATRGVQAYFIAQKLWCQE